MNATYARANHVTFPIFFLTDGRWIVSGYEGKAKSVAMYKANESEWFVTHLVKLEAIDFAVLQLSSRSENAELSR